ncbi:siderophore-interacting protein [Rhodococcus tukisamuensis]|uniref:NADPH-dependent ferric siderophore reductase, contains FAD-binding and SIP domains n=1 Tax=Rhodococcus tukisamuensis TaxID=168276 RepID=A0A1G6XIQ9_9NOCA|nr:siderophore-interacting protein [Rhodococcus tukisamuensis]SDD78124.1 NADPH-dependent ferric siderophore reductase, contains FAD-binding and SIP domains [Rhodococcus tukisamuensis]
MPTDDEPRFHAAVTAAVPVSPSLRRIRFAGPGLAGFASSGDPDERLLVEFGDEARSYTVRHWDPAAHALDVDFAVHAGGAAAAWARGATPGMPVRLSRPKGWYRPPADARWQLLLADLSALPAAARIVETLPAGVAAHLIAEVPEAADEQRWTTPADLTVTWLHGTGNGLTPSALPDRLATLDLPAGPGYLWSAGETGASRRIRRHVRRELGWTSDRFDVMGYWQADKERWLAGYRRVEARIEELTVAGLSAGQSLDEVRDTVDDALTEAGL